MDRFELQRLPGVSAPSRDFRLELDTPDTVALNRVCDQWGLEDTFEPWQGYAMSREPALSATKEIQAILEAASSRT